MIEPTDEMLAAFLAAWDDENRIINESPGEYFEVGARDRAGLAAVLALIERDYRKPSEMLMYAGGVARGIANRLEAKPGDRNRWIAMSAGARLVAIRMVELADDADGNGFQP